MSCNVAHACECRIISCNVMWVSWDVMWMSCDVAHSGAPWSRDWVCSEVRGLRQDLCDSLRRRSGKPGTGREIPFLPPPPSFYLSLFLLHSCPSSLPPSLPPRCLKPSTWPPCGSSPVSLSVRTTGMVWAPLPQGPLPVQNTTAEETIFLALR